MATTRYARGEWGTDDAAVARGRAKADAADLWARWRGVAGETGDIDGEVRLYWAESGVDSTPAYVALVAKLIQARVYERARRARGGRPCAHEHRRVIEWGERSTWGMRAKLRCTDCGAVSAAIRPGPGCAT